MTVWSEVYEISRCLRESSNMRYAFPNDKKNKKSLLSPYALYVEKTMTFISRNKMRKTKFFTPMMKVAHSYRRARNLIETFVCCNNSLGHPVYNKVRCAHPPRLSTLPHSILLYLRSKLFSIKRISACQVKLQHELLNASFYFIRVVKEKPFLQNRQSQQRTSRSNICLNNCSRFLGFHADLTAN